MNVHTRFVERVRHELKFRIATVTKVERITPKMARIVVHSPDFDGFVSAGYDDHVKLFFAEPGQSLDMPVRTDNGLEFPGGVRPEARDYTPRYFNPQTNELTLDFVLHGDGPASNWAENAKPGDTLGVGGPRGSFVLRGEFDWYLLVGDETALPAIGRRIEELPNEARIIAVIEIADAAERQTFPAQSGLDVHWIERDVRPRADTDRLLDAVRSITLPQGEGYVFIAGESAMSKAVRKYLVDERGQNTDWIKAAGYWQAGSSDFDDGHAH